MKFFKIILVFLIIAAFAISLWNKIHLQKYKRMYEIQKKEKVRIEGVSKKIEEAVIKAQMASMKHIGKKLIWENIEKIYPKEDSKQGNYINPKLVLIFSELGCNVCQDNETAFAVDIANVFGKNFVLAVINASNKRYARNYIRMNQINFPVYFCKDDLFLNGNNIKNTPMIFVINEEDRVIASTFPIPGHPIYSKPIHEFCFYYFK